MDQNQINLLVEIDKKLKSIHKSVIFFGLVLLLVLLALIPGCIFYVDSINW